MAPFKAPPNSFEEFFRDCPDFVPNVVRNFFHNNPKLSARHRAQGFQNVYDADLEEYIQETYLHLMSLSEDSIHRQRGCTDKIQAYDPSLCPSNLSPRKHFKLFLTEVIRRFLIVHRTRRKRDASEQETRTIRHNTIIVSYDFTTPQLVGECVNHIARVVVTTDEGPKIKRGEWKTLATKLGIPQQEHQRRKSRVDLFVKKYLVSITG